jgi:uncharacterized membrane protein YqjE
MEPAPTAPAGYLAALRSLGENLLAGARDRLELFSLELQEEKFRLIKTFLWISAVAFSGMMAIMFASLTLVYLFWESARLAVLAGLTIFYGITLGALVIAFRRFLARQPRPFAATTSELGEDRACMRNGS